MVRKTIERGVEVRDADMFGKKSSKCCSCPSEYSFRSSNELDRTRTVVNRIVVL